MPDITMCPGYTGNEICERRNTCFRYTAIPKRYHQSYSSPPEPIASCGRYLMEIRQWQKYRCRVNIRADYDGRQIKPGCLPLQGVELILEALWINGEDESYAGEWAMGAADEVGHKMLRNSGAYWIASGDIEVISEIAE